MTTMQLKQAVIKTLNQMPDEVLADLLEYIKFLQGKDEKSILRAKHLRRILDEDSVLLKALAQ